MYSFDYKRDIVHTLSHRIRESLRFIQVLTGPRQAGKTTAVHQVWKINRII